LDTATATLATSLTDDRDAQAGNENKLGKADHGGFPDKLNAE
jgi:hypothetical protein